MAALGHFVGELDVRYIKLPKRRWWLRWLPQRRRWLVLQPFTWCGADGNCITVPAGFVTDFASIPFFALLILGPTNGLVSDYGRAACVHDLLYQRGALQTPPVTRQAADRVFNEAMLYEEVLALTRWSMWLAVRGFGWTAYKKSA